MSASLEIKEVRRLKSKTWRLKHGVPTVDGLVRQCRNCGNNFSPRHITALACSKSCAVEWNRINRVRPNYAERFDQRARYNHGLSTEKWIVMLAIQNGLCKMCNEPFIEGDKFMSACLDHNHKCCRVGASCEKCRRGFIHHRCNLIIGHAKDSVPLLKTAIAYLEDNAILL